MDILGLRQLVAKARIKAMEWLEQKNKNAYWDYARYRLKSRINDEFNNYDMAYTQIIASVMIGECSRRESVRIYSNTLIDECCGDALKKSQARSIKVLLDGINDSNISGLTWLKGIPAYRNRALEIRVIDDIKKMASENDIEIPEGYFFLTSANAYWQEADCNHGKIMARVNFYDPSETKRLSRLFDDWFALGKPIDLKGLVVG